MMRGRVFGTNTRPRVVDGEGLDTNTPSSPTRDPRRSSRYFLRARRQVSFELVSNPSRIIFKSSDLHLPSSFSKSFIPSPTITCDPLKHITGRPVRFIPATPTINAPHLASYPTCGEGLESTDHPSLGILEVFRHCRVFSAESFQWSYSHGILVNPFS